MTIERMHIRHYVTAMLREGVAVGGRVFANRPSKVFENELPLVIVSFAKEDAEVWVGDKRCPRVHARELTLYVDILAEEPPAANKADPNADCEADDILDRLAEQAERTLFGDPFLEQRLPGYDENSAKNEGLAMSTVLESVSPFDVDTESARRVVGQRITVALTYAKDVYAAQRLPDFASYGMRIRNSSDLAEADAEGAVQ